jgi:hypothetical protein
VHHVHATAIALRDAEAADGDVVNGPEREASSLEVLVDDRLAFHFRLDDDRRVRVRSVIEFRCISLTLRGLGVGAGANDDDIAGIGG